MKKIVWSDEYSVGHATLDNQHIKIINMINNLDEHINDSASSEVITDIIDETSKYAKHHLEYEEALLESLEYPDFVNHKEHHFQYLESVADLTYKASFDDEGTVVELLNFLIIWWTEHILYEDMKYKTLLESKLNG